MPDIEQETMAARLTSLLPGDHMASGRVHLHHRTATSRAWRRIRWATSCSPRPIPFYPTNYPGLDNTRNVTVGWRMVPAGNRTNESISDASRVVFDLRGVHGWLGLQVPVLFASSSNQASDGAVDGYVNAPFVRAEVAAGRLNPFAEATPAQLAIIEQAKRKGTFATLVRATVSGAATSRCRRSCSAMGGGKAAMALFGEVRREGYRNDTDDAVVAGHPLGRPLAQPRDGQSRRLRPGGRNAAAGHQAAGDSRLRFVATITPTPATRSTRRSRMKFQPFKSLLIRGSYNTGFRAPTLDELYGPQSITFAAGAVNDPLLCPNGVVNAAGGGVTSRDCGAQVQVQQGGNPNLKPEKSKTFSVGIALEPVRNLTFSADYWNIKLRDQVNAIDQISVLANPTLYANKIVRCTDIPVAQQAELNRCGADNLNSNAIGYVVTLTDNIGKVLTSGVDLSAGYVLNAGGAGTFAFNWDGTWVKSYKYQNTATDPLKENVGMYIDSSPIFRWQHTIGMRWTLGDFATRLGIRHKTGYTDQNSPTTVVGGPSFYGKVDAYTLIDLSATAKLGKNFQLTAGVTNLLDKDPPFSNQSTRSQRGFDPRYTDPVGRALFLRGSLTF